MTADQKLLLENLLDRLDADAESQHPQFRGIVSDKEREALRSLLTEPATVPQPLEPPPKPLPEPVDEPTLEPADQPIETGEEGEPDSVCKLNIAALGYESSPKPEWTLCLDFGTAKSKAFAATNDEEDPELLPLPIGKADGDVGSVHEVSSSAWIDDDGLLFLGSKAVKLGIDYGNSTRRRLDSLKLHLVLDHTHWEQELPKDMDPTSTLTYSDIILAYLAYLTDLATTELERDKRVMTRYVRRRFTLPWWEKEQRNRAGAFLKNGLAHAQLLADTFHGRWHSGIPVNEIKRILQDATAHAEQLSWMVLTEPEGGVLEALAAASARVWSDGSARGVMLVVDVGAGTTDISSFWVVQRTPSDGQQVRSPEELMSFHRAWPIQPCGSAIGQAGDALDRLLVAELMRKANLGADKALRQRVSDSLYRRNVRQLKERLFNADKITERLVSDHIVEITREEFLKSEGVKNFENRISAEIEKLLGGIHESWEQVTKGGITLVLTGGGSSLPMIRNLADRRWKIGKREIVCQLAKAVPATVEERFSSDFIQEYPRLTVAMGGALNTLLDERDAMDEWPGDAPVHRLESKGKIWS